jgi:predicted lipoprotein with Yx(FWY)xxD motif
MNASIRSVTTRSALAAAGLLTALALTACGSTYSADPQNAANTGAAPVTASAAAPAADATPDAAEPEAAEPEASGDAGAAEDVGKTPTTLKRVKTLKMGEVVTDEKGWILYRFDNDKPKPPDSNCNGDCAKVWPPVVADDQEIVGLDAAKIGTVTRDDGVKQVTLGGWPLYYYLGDKKPGDWTGQNVGKVWFAAAPDGTKNITCLPENPPKPPTPPADQDADASPAAGDGGEYSY